jgi:hypothetical protein
MIAEPPGVWVALLFCFDKEHAVSPVKPVPEVPPADAAPEHIQLGRLVRSLSSVPTSPKAHELRARHESRLYSKVI